MSKSTYLHTFIPLNISKFSFMTTLILDGQEITATDGYLLEDWDYGSSIDVKFVVKPSNLESYYKNKIEKGMRLLFTLNWYSPLASGGTSLRGRIDSSEYAGWKTKKEIELSGSIPGDRISGELLLIFQVVVLDPGQEVVGFATNQILAERKQVIILEGRKPQFPIQIVSFSSNPELPQNGLFYLRRDFRFCDLHEQFSSNYLLLLNKDNPMVSAINPPQKNNRVSQEALKMLMYSVYQEIVWDIISQMEKYEEWESENDEGFSVGAVYENILENLFPNTDFSEKKTALQRIKNRPKELCKDLQRIIF